MLTQNTLLGVRSGLHISPDVIMYDIIIIVYVIILQNVGETRLAWIRTIHPTR